MPLSVAPGRSPTPGLLFGLILTLAAVVVYSAYTIREIARLRTLQSDLVDRNRRDSLQLLRIQNNLNQLGLAMRDMLDDEHPYPLSAWVPQFARIRGDLEDALTRDGGAFAIEPPADERARLVESLAQFWAAVDRMFALADAGDVAEAKTQVAMSLQARQAALTSTVARLLFENNERDEAAAGRVQAIYDQVQRQAYWFLAGTLVAIGAMSFYVMRANRRLFAELSALADGRRELAQQLISTRESTLRHLSRELHDEFGQVLTAMGSMLGRAERHAPEGAPLRAELREIAGIAQTTLDSVRGLSQTLHPSILEELGLESTFEWYLATVERQLGLHVTWERTGDARDVDSAIGIHVYRVLQEALSNVARHARTTDVQVRLHYRDDHLVLHVEDHGSGLPEGRERRGLGMVAMRERAALVGGSIEFLPVPGGGTLVRLTVPLLEEEMEGVKEAHA